jgi:hypothetical protein
MAGLSEAIIDLNPLKKNSLLTINRQGTIYQHQDYLVIHHLFQQ